MARAVGIDLDLGRVCTGGRRARTAGQHRRLTHHLVGRRVRQELPRASRPACQEPPPSPTLTAPPAERGRKEMASDAAGMVGTRLLCRPGRPFERVGRADQEGLSQARPRSAPGCQPAGPPEPRTASRQSARHTPCSRTRPNARTTTRHAAVHRRPLRPHPIPPPASEAPASAAISTSATCSREAQPPPPRVAE